MICNASTEGSKGLRLILAAVLLLFLLITDAFIATCYRSNRPGMNMLHYVALQAEKVNPELLTLPEDLGILEEASK